MILSAWGLLRLDFVYVEYINLHIGATVETVKQCQLEWNVYAAIYEVEHIKSVMEQYGSQENISCITEHEGFDAVCLNIWVLQAAYFAYRQRYGTRDVQDHPLHE